MSTKNIDKYILTYLDDIRERPETGYIRALWVQYIVLNRICEHVLPYTTFYKRFDYFLNNSPRSLTV